MIDKDEDCLFKPVVEVDHGFQSGNFIKDIDYDLPGRLSTSSWASSTITEEEVRSETPHQIRDAYSYLLECLPLKQVPIGPEYQADIPECCGYDENEDKFTGSCVILMPEDNSPTVGKGRTDCYCANPESYICVQQHIKESRETLKESVGHKRFAELGFDNMGEVVAEKWSEEDEELFHEVIYSNPVSLGKNFWVHLEAEFPSRTYQEIVCYYFNVFVLRRRAEQNRCDPSNADSDDDEWQGSDRSEENDEILKFDSQSRKLHNSCSSDSLSQPSEKTNVDESGDGDCDFQSDSCTSSDGSGEQTRESWGNHEFIFEPLDSESRVWDDGYFSCLRTKTDFLPTVSMIEEVFGVESWNFEGTDDDDKCLN